jgi:hypothetical protein
MDRAKVKQIIKYSLIALFVLIIIVYTGFEISRYITGPKIIITSPENGLSLNTSLVEIIGKAVNITEVQVNDSNIFMDEEGNFSQKVLLSPGYNVLKVHGEDKFGRETEKVLELFYK